MDGTGAMDGAGTVEAAGPRIAGPRIEAGTQATRRAMQPRSGTLSGERNGGGTARIGGRPEKSKSGGAATRMTVRHHVWMNR